MVRDNALYRKTKNPTKLAGSENRIARGLLRKEAEFLLKA